MTEGSLILDLPAAIDRAICRSAEAGRHLDLMKRPPLHVALVGPPGAGKSTIVRAFRDSVREDGLIPDWQACLVEYPGLERAADLQGQAFARLWRDPVGILYVLPSRGPNDEDEQALEMLRSRNVVALENIRDSELYPARSNITLLELPELGCPFAVPIVPIVPSHSRRNMPPAEHRLLRECIAFLETGALSVDSLRETQQRAAAAQVQLRADIGDQWQKIVDISQEPTLTDHLEGVRRLLILRDDCAACAPFDRELNELIRLLERSSAISPPMSLSRLRRYAEAAADRYNVEAGGRMTPTRTRSLKGARQKPRSAWTEADDSERPGEDLEFGQQYREMRQQLQKFIENLLRQHSTLTLTKEERQSLERVSRMVDEDNVDIALLGRFSSGKSSLINSLLGVRPNDKQPQLLPTNVRPETATVNRVCYGANDEVRVDWLADAELMFAEETSQPGQLRLHIDEIRSFHAWITDCGVTPKDVTYRALPEEFLTPGEEISLEPEAFHTAFNRVWNDLRFPDSPPRFAYAGDSPAYPRLTDLNFPASATIDPLPSAGELWPVSGSRADAFSTVHESFPLALLIDRLNIAFSHPLLKHASFIDTPGTDAPIPHHRRVAHRIIRDQNCPVIYCFLGERPGGTEDRDNLELLKQWGIGTKDLNRFFFVITMKAKIAEAEQDAVREHVRRCLHEIGIRAPTVYFVDVVHYPDDDEFQALKEDVEGFIVQSRSGLFQSWLDHVRGIVAGARNRCANQLDAIQEGVTQRNDRLRRLQGQADAVTALLEEFRSSSQRGAPWMRGRIDASLKARADQVITTLDGLTSRKAFEGIEQRLGDALIELNRECEQVLKSTCEGFLAKLQSEVAGIRTDIVLRAAVPQIDEDLFASTDVLAATHSMYWRGLVRRGIGRVLGGGGIRADVDDNRERIVKPWRQSEEAATAKSRSLVEAWIEDLQRELSRALASIRSELSGLAEVRSPDAQHKFEKACTLADDWTTRFDALSRQAVAAKGGG